MFELTEEQRALKQMVAEFSLKEIAPYVQEWEEKGEFNREVFSKMASLGLTGIVIPERYGGAGLDYLSYILVIEELVSRSGMAAAYLSIHHTVQAPIYQFGTEKQKEKYLVPLAQGKWLGAFVLTITRYISVSPHW